MGDDRLFLTSLLRGMRRMMSASASSQAMEMAGTMSVPRSMQRMRRVESGSGMPMQMYERKGAI